MTFTATNWDFLKTRRYDFKAGQFTNVFWAAPEDAENAAEGGALLLEHTYNWPDVVGITEEYTDGRNFIHLADEVESIYNY